MKTSDLHTITEAIRAGKVILYPTDTIWGLGCDATNEDAVKKIIDIKKRDNAKSFVCIVADDAMLNKTFKEIPSLAWDLLDESDTPLTLVLPNSKGLAKQVSADDKSLAVRMIKNGQLQQLVHRLRKPLVSTSANFSGEKPAIDLSDVSEEILDKVDLIVDFETSGMTKKASSIIKLEMNGEITILRK